MMKSLNTNDDDKAEGEKIQETNVILSFERKVDGVSIFIIRKLN